MKSLKSWRMVPTFTFGELCACIASSVVASMCLFVLAGQLTLSHLIIVLICLQRLEGNDARHPRYATGSGTEEGLGL